MKNKIIYGILIFLIIGLFSANFVFAQEAAPSAGAEAVAEMVALDENIGATDLGVKEPWLLPDSPFYFLKNWGRGIRTFFTFNSVAKAELKLKFANEKLIELKTIIEKGEGAEIVKKAAENYQKEMDKIKEKADEIKEKAKESQKVESFLDKFINQETLHQKLLYKLETQVPAESLEKIKETREEHLDKFQEVMLKLEDRKEKITEKLDEILDKQKGSEFKNFKNLEVLKNLEEKVPEEAREAIQKAQENALKRLQGDLEKIAPEYRQEFDGYVEKISGEKERHLEILEDLKKEIIMSPLTAGAVELKQKIEEGKIQILEKIEKAKPEVCIQVVTPAISPEGKCKEFGTPCDVPAGWRKIEKCPPEPTELRYYTCPDGTKVVSGKCYGEGEKLSCAITMRPEIQCPQQTPPVTRGAECLTQGEIRYFKCADGTQIPWCVCLPEGSFSGAKNKWQCQYYPVGFNCSGQTTSPGPAPTQRVAEGYIKCTREELKKHKCPDGTEVAWQCECLNMVPQATAYWVWKCQLEPAKFCSISETSNQPTVTRIEIRHYGSSLQFFWNTNIATISYMEYGPTTSYGSRAGGLTGDVGSLDTPGTQFVIEGQRLSLGTTAESKLRPDTTYHFRIVAQDTKNNVFISQDYTFATVPECFAAATKEGKRYYACPDGSRVEWCKCTAEGKWDCISSPQSACPASQQQTAAPCKIGETQQYKCQDGTTVTQCKCATEGKWDCVSYPEKLCPVSPL